MTNNTAAESFFKTLKTIDQNYYRSIKEVYIFVFEGIKAFHDTKNRIITIHFFLSKEKL